MRPFTLTAVKTGISRLRVKGGARPDSMYDLVNARLNAAKEIVPRPGSLSYTTIGTSVVGTRLPTFGLAYFQEKFHVFGDRWFPLNTDTDDTVLHVLPYPESGDDSPRLAEIILAEPFLRYLFVVAKFDNGEVFYYWLTEGNDGGEAWLPNHVYDLSQVVRPVIPNGYYYRATRRYPAGDLWAPSVEREIGDVVEPTEFNGYEYVCIDIQGARPRSGLVEPDWPAEDGAIVYEDADNTDPKPPVQTGGGDNRPPGDVIDRYDRGSTRVTDRRSEK